jgi:hypothetical protein
MEPFKVMCTGHLDLNKVPAWAKKLPLTKPEIGDRCTVTEVSGKGKLKYYTLSEFPTYQEYDSRAFATLPDTSADEMQEQGHEAIINIETQPV